IFVLFYFSCSDVAFETMIDFSLTKDDLQTYLARQGKDNALQENDEELTITATLYDEKDKEIAVVPQKFSLEEKEYRIQFEKIPVGQQVKAFISIVLNDCILAQLSSDYVTVKEGNTLIPLHWDAITTATYKIEHYQQNIETDEYSLIDTQYETGTIGVQTTAEAKTYPGFISQEFSQQTITKDNPTVVKIFYNRKVVKLTFDLAGGFLGETEETFELSGKYGEAVVLPEEPTKEGYIFVGWDKELPTTFTLEIEDKNYTAIWRDENQVADVIFEPNTETMDNDELVTLSCETENAIIYYNFENKEFNLESCQKDGWIEYNTDMAEGIELLADASKDAPIITLYAIAVYDGMINSNITSVTYSLAEYTVRFTTNCEETITSLEVVSGEEIILKPYSELSKEGYDFAGWYLDEECTHSVGDSGILIPSKKLANGNNEISLYAKWTPVEYTITYELNAAEDTSGPENPNAITSYTIEKETITLQNPTRNGYDFVGWYTDENCTHSISQIEKGSTGDITLYAQWQKIDTSIDVTFPSYNDPKGLSITYDEGSQTFTAEGVYSSYEWYIDGELKSRDKSLNTDNMSGGIYTVMLIVTTNSGDMYSAEYQVIITKECQVIITKIEEN
ncbi:MAG: hypothetical protein E7062_10720, partial [Spirochaetaceae bacterium]|nr:hypothetical protein [Spirochaetaceae bacterium]